MEQLKPEEAFARSMPIPYALLSSLDENGRPNVMGISWVTRTSFTPFLITVSVDHGRYTHACISRHREFVVSYPDAHQRELALLCGTKSGRDVDKVKEANIELLAGSVVRAPIVGGATVAFECRVVSEFETGDHTVFVGEVVAAHGDPAKTTRLFATSSYSLFGIDDDGRSTVM